MTPRLISFGAFAPTFRLSKAPSFNNFAALPYLVIPVLIELGAADKRRRGVLSTNRTVLGLVTIIFLAACSSGGISTSESFDAASADGLMVVGLKAVVDPGGEHAMTWWPYVEETNEFLPEPNKGIEVVRSRYDSWAWGGGGMDKKKFILLRVAPGLYALQSTRLLNFEKSKATDSLLVEIESGKTSYIGDYEFSFENIEPYLGMPLYHEIPFRFEYSGHDIDGVNQALQKYSNVNAELIIVVPTKLVVN